ncbi:MFS transporter, partial [Staphylococcus pettenkoferi]
LTLQQNQKNFVILLIVLFLMEFVRGMFVLSYIPLIPNINNISIMFSTLLMTLHFIFDALSNFFIGFILKKTGSKIVINILLTISLIIYVLVYIYPDNLIILVLASIILGIAVTPIWVSILAAAKKKTRGQQMGYVYFGWLGGLLIGMVFMNVISDVYSKSAIITMPFLILTSLVIYQFTNNEYNLLVNEVKKVELSKTKEIIRKHFPLVLGISIQGLAISTLLPILPLYAINVKGTSATEYTVILTLGSIGCVISMLTFPKIIDRYNKIMYFIIVFGFLFYSLGIFSIVFVKEISILYFIAIFIGSIYGILLPTWNAFVASFIPKSEKEETWGIFNSLQGLGAMLGMLIGGTLKTLSDFDYVFYFASLCIFSLFIFYCIFLKGKHKKKGEIYNEKR